MNQTTILPWLCITLVLVSISWFRQKGKTPPVPEQQILFSMGLNAGAIMVFAQVIYKAITIAELYKILEWDGVTMLCLGSLAGVVASAKGIWELLK